MYDACKYVVSVDRSSQPCGAFTLSSVSHTKVCKTEFLNVVLQSHALVARVGLLNERLDRGEVFPGGCTICFLVSDVSQSNSGCSTYGTLWSTVARVQSGLLTPRPALRLKNFMRQICIGCCAEPDSQALECLWRSDFVNKMSTAS